MVVVLGCLSPILDLLNKNIRQFQGVFSDKSDKFGVLANIPMEEAEFIIVVLDLQDFVYYLGDTLVKSCIKLFVLSPSIMRLEVWMN